MRRYVFAAAAAVAVLLAGSAMSSRAEALPASTAVAVGGEGLIQDAAYVCRRVRVCGPYGCHWRRSCYWTGRHYPYRRYRYYRRHYW